MKYVTSFLSFSFLFISFPSFFPSSPIPSLSLFPQEDHLTRSGPLHRFHFCRGVLVFGRNWLILGNWLTRAAWNYFLFGARNTLRMLWDAVQKSPWIPEPSSIALSVIDTPLLVFLLFCGWSHWSCWMSGLLCYRSVRFNTIFQSCGKMNTLVALEQLYSVHKLPNHLSQSSEEAEMPCILK